MKRQLKQTLAGTLTLAMMLGASGGALAAQVQGTQDPGVSVTVDGKPVDLKDANGNPVEPVIIDGTTYLPVRAVSEANGLNVDWDGESREVKLTTGTQAGSFVMPEKVDKSTQPRIIITTDLEVDDMNGIMLSLMYANEYDLAGIVWTAGMFHFNGDGEHTLAEITPNYRCEATTAGGTVENAGQVMSMRPADPTFLTRIIDVNYRADYEYLSKNNPNYPTPDELLSIAKVGNVEFEGDYRFETEGSELIYQCIMDDDPRPLYIQHWGGINTTVRALYSIYEDFHDTDQWDEVLAKVVGKVRISGSGEDNCRADSKIDEMFPGLQNSDWTGFGGFTDFFAIHEAPEALRTYYKAEFLTDAFKFNHGRVMGEFHLMNDGQPIYGEPFCYQYGLVNYIDWAQCAKEGWASPAIGTVLDFFPLGQRSEYETYDWMCAQFGCASFVDLGLRQGVINSDDRFVAALFEDLAARADWAVMAPEKCNHAPVVSAEALDITAKAGETVELKGVASDPDGDELAATWWVPSNAWTYAAVTPDKGEEEATGDTGRWEPPTGESKPADDAEVVEAPELKVSDEHALATQFTVPEDAIAGDRFVVNLEVKDNAERPITRYAQVIITVE